jgi:hypothetical protein
MTAPRRPQRLSRCRSPVWPQSQESSRVALLPCACGSLAEMIYRVPTPAPGFARGRRDRGAGAETAGRVQRPAASPAGGSRPVAPPGPRGEEDSVRAAAAGRVRVGVVGHHLGGIVVDHRQAAGVLDRHKRELAVAREPVVPARGVAGMSTGWTANVCVSSSEIWAGVPRTVTTSLSRSSVSWSVSGGGHHVGVAEAVAEARTIRALLWVRAVC